MILPCAKCGTDVPEGASSCPKCGASLASIVLSKERRGLTKTLIGKAVELRNSIPWANPSQVVLLDDPRRPGKKKVRPAAMKAFVLLAIANVIGIGLYVSLREPTQVFEVVTTPPETRPLVKEPEARPAPEAKPEPKPEPRVVPPPEPRPEPKPAPPVKTAVAPAPAPAPAKAVATPVGALPGKKPPGTLVVVALHKGKPVTDAVVRINGVNLGGTPVNAPVAPGKYTVKVEKAGFISEKRTDVEVRPGKKQAVTVELKR